MSFTPKDLLGSIRDTETGATTYDWEPSWPIERLKAGLNLVVDEQKSIYRAALKHNPQKFSYVVYDINIVNQILALKEIYPNARVPLNIIAATALNSFKYGEEMRMPHMLVHGKPSTGKSAVIQEVLDIFPLEQINLSGGIQTTPAYMTGFEKTYNNSDSGQISKLIMKSEAYQAFIFIDEIDKACFEGKDDPTPVLLNLMQPETAKLYHDKFFEMKIDAGGLTFFMTANEIDHLHPALLSRLLVYKMEELKFEERRLICKRIFESCINEYKDISKTIDDSIIDEVSKLEPRAMKIAFRSAISQLNLRTFNSRKGFAYGITTRSRINLELQDFDFSQHKVSLSPYCSTKAGFRRQP